MVICSPETYSCNNHPKIHLFTHFFLEMGCPKHSLHAHIDFIWQE